MHAVRQRLSPCSPVWGAQPPSGTRVHPAPRRLGRRLRRALDCALMPRAARLPAVRRPLLLQLQMGVTSTPEGPGQVPAAQRRLGWSQGMPCPQACCQTCSAAQQARRQVQGRRLLHCCRRACAGCRAGVTPGRLRPVVVNQTVMLCACVGLLLDEAAAELAGLSSLSWLAAEGMAQLAEVSQRGSELWLPRRMQALAPRLLSAPSALQPKRCPKSASSPSELRHVQRQQCGSSLLHTDSMLAETLDSCCFQVARHCQEGRGYIPSGLG